jgi:hypothetical protein
MPIKVIKAIPIKPVRIKEMPSPLRGLGISEYLSFSRIAAILTIARNHPIPEPSAKTVASPRFYNHAAA